MKTAISIPDAIFHAAEETAKRLGVSRSELYARAVEAYLKTHGGEGITEKLNEVLADQDSTLDPVIARMQWLSIEPEAW